MALGITGAVGPKVAAPEGVIVVAGPLRFVRDIAESFVVVGAAVAFAVGASPSPVCGVGDAKDGGGRDAPVVMVVAGLVRLALLLFFGREGFGRSGDRGDGATLCTTGGGAATSTVVTVAVDAATAASAGASFFADTGASEDGCCCGGDCGCRACGCCSCGGGAAPPRFSQFRHLQRVESHLKPAEKQSQYFLMHLDFLQKQRGAPPGAVPPVCIASSSARSRASFNSMPSARKMCDLGRNVRLLCMRHRATAARRRSLPLSLGWFQQSLHPQLSTHVLPDEKHSQ